MKLIFNPRNVASHRGQKKKEKGTTQYVAKKAKWIKNWLDALEAAR